MNILAELRQRFNAALQPLTDDDLAALLDMVRPSQDSRHGDYQANCAMPLGKRLGQPPREVAQQIVHGLDVADFCQQPQIAGPGFINLTVRDDWLARQLNKARKDERLGVAAAAPPRSYVIDYSAPNVAKPMHVGHIRSTVIGDALARTLRFLGHRVISDNHIGDWGTQFGMIIYGFKHFLDQQAYDEAPVQELARLYRLVNQLVDYQQGRASVPEARAKLAKLIEQFDAGRDASPPGDAQAQKRAAKAHKKLQHQVSAARQDLAALTGKLEQIEKDSTLGPLAREHSDIASAVLRETAALHAGDETNRSLWQQFLPHCQEDIDRIYRRLNVQFDHTLGESYYQDQLVDVVTDLQAQQIARASDGAVCVFLDGYDTPMIVQKQDGAFLYSTTDLATIQYRQQTWQPDAILYVVDHRQSLHFEQLFATARRWGYDTIDFAHVKFGTVLGEDRRPFKTRSGSTVGLDGLLDEAVQRALAVVSENDDLKETAGLSPDDRQRIAEVVGIAALKYADLSQNRESDYVFSYDKMLALNGNTATYMQYAYARVRNIFAKGNVDIDQLRDSGASITLTHPAERALGLALLQFS
ncbi:MAG: arginine--tRNA ligase, partial [Planctomycetota bacterium]|nr:arginine--tRNA ligase [Planctomycetota bacterium]